jgi:hypothetical protein
MKASPRPDRRQASLGGLMLLLAGAGLGFWMISGDIQVEFTGKGRSPLPNVFFGRWDSVLLMLAVGVLAGLSFMGAILLLVERWRHRRVWHEGRLLWFTHGIATWLLAPPLIYHRSQGHSVGQTYSGVCLFYGTPLMAIYMTFALLGGGRFRRSHLRMLSRSWKERFGLIIALAWACTGAYLLFLYYRSDFRR